MRLTLNLLKSSYSKHLQGVQYVPVLQREVIVGKVLKISNNDSNTIQISLKNLFFLKVAREWLEI